MIVFPVRGGVLAVPAVLPIHVSDDELKLTVADWLALKESPMPFASPDPDLSEPVAVTDGQLPLPPYADAGPTSLDPDQGGLPQEPGSAVESAVEDEEVTGDGV